MVIIRLKMVIRVGYAGLIISFHFWAAKIFRWDIEKVICDALTFPILISYNFSWKMHDKFSIIFCSQFSLSEHWWCSREKLMTWIWILFLSTRKKKKTQLPPTEHNYSLSSSSHLLSHDDVCLHLKNNLRSSSRQNNKRFNLQHSLVYFFIKIN